MKPTIGRIVHFQPAIEGAGVHPAIITKVWSDTCVNLQVFGDGILDAQGNLPTSVVEGAPGTARSWFWPPRE